MAKLLTDNRGVTHLRSSLAFSLCGASVEPELTEGTLTCPVCAKQVLIAIELSTKAERREWRKL